MLLTIDYRIALRTLSHNFIQAALNFFSFPPMFVKLGIASLRSQYRFLVGCAAIKEFTFSHEAGIDQGDPFPPQLFSFCAAIAIYPLHELQAPLALYLYVDDFLITFASHVTLRQLEQVFHQLRKFSATSGLQLNLDKSAYVTKGVLADPVLGYMAQSGL